MEAARLKAQVRAVAARKKKKNVKGKERASSSTPNTVNKGEEGWQEGRLPIQKGVYHFWREAPQKAITSQVEARGRQGANDDVQPRHPGS